MARCRSQKPLKPADELEVSDGVLPQGLPRCTVLLRYFASYHFHSQSRSSCSHVLRACQVQSQCSYIVGQRSYSCFAEVCDSSVMVTWAGRMRPWEATCETPKDVKSGQCSCSDCTSHCQSESTPCCHMADY